MESVPTAKTRLSLGPADADSLASCESTASRISHRRLERSAARLSTSISAPSTSSTIAPEPASTAGFASVDPSSNAQSKSMVSEQGVEAVHQPRIAKSSRPSRRTTLVSGGAGGYQSRFAKSSRFGQTPAKPWRLHAGQDKGYVPSQDNWPSATSALTTTSCELQHPMTYQRVYRPSGQYHILHY